MTSAAAYDLLERLVQREGRSLLQYIGEAFPWTTAQDQRSVPELLRLVTQDREAIVRIAAFLNRHHHPVGTLQSFPSRWTSINFAALEHILPLLVQAQKESIQAIERDLAPLTDPATRHEAEALLQLKRQHLLLLDELTARHSQPTATLR